MSTFETIRDLKSFQSSQAKLIPRKIMGKILEAGRQAPSPGNVQSVEFIVVEGNDEKRTLATASGDERFNEAPTAVIVLTDTDRMARRVGQEAATDAASSEAACAVQNMRLAAREEDISSCWVTGFDQGQIEDSFGVPSAKSARAIVGFCYPETEYDKPERFGLNSVVFYDQYDNQMRSLFDQLEWKGVREMREHPRGSSGRLIKKIRDKLQKYL